jgi:hypothetical protein
MQIEPACGSARTPPPTRSGEPQSHVRSPLPHKRYATLHPGQIRRAQPRHPRIGLQQFTDARLGLIDDRTTLWPLIFRRCPDASAALTVLFDIPSTWAITLIGNPPPDAADESQPTDNIPFVPLLARVKPGHRTRGQNSVAAGVSFHVPPTFVQALSVNTGLNSAAVPLRTSNAGARRIVAGARCWRKPGPA